MQQLLTHGVSIATVKVAMQPYSFRDSENAQRLTKNTWGEKSENFLLLLVVRKNYVWYKLKAQVKQIKTQLWPFKNCLLLPEISSFIHRDDFWSIVKLVAYARQSLKTGRFSMVLLVFLAGLKVSRKSSMQYWLVGLKNAHVYTFSLLRVAYQTLSRLMQPLSVLWNKPFHQQMWHHFSQLSCFFCFL